MSLLLLLLGCDDDPALEPFAASLAAWDEGRAALADGRPADAVTAFAAARTHDPGSVALRPTGLGCSSTSRGRVCSVLGSTGGSGASYNVARSGATWGMSSCWNRPSTTLGSSRDAITAGGRAAWQPSASTAIPAAAQRKST